jgi:RNase P subunit RPR2
MADEIHSFCRDADCDECGWPETYTEVREYEGIPYPLAIGCRKCGWRMEVGELTVDG